MKLKYGHVYFTLLIFFLCFSSYNFAASFPATGSTISPHKPHKITRQQFMDTYGTDATSRALIRYYYPKYEANKILTIYSGSTMVLTSGLAGLVVLTFGSNLLTLLIAIALGTAAYIAAGIFVVSGIFLLLKSRKRLYRLLQQYQQSGKLPHHTSRKKPFLRLLKQEQLRK